MNGAPLSAQQALDIFEELASKDEKHHWGFTIERGNVSTFRPPLAYRLNLVSDTCLQYNTTYSALILEWLPPAMYTSLVERSHDIKVKVVSGELITEKSLASVLTSTQ